MPVGTAGGDHHVVADGRFPLDVDRYHRFGFRLVERCRDDCEKGFRAVSRRHEFGWRRALASTLKCGWHFVLMVLSSSNPCRAAKPGTLAGPDPRNPSGGDSTLGKIEGDRGCFQVPCDFTVAGARAWSRRDPLRGRD